MRMSYIQLLGEQHPLCLSLTAYEQIDDRFGSFDAMCDKLTGDNPGEIARTVNDVLEILLRAGRVYGSAMGMELPEKLPCKPADVIDVTEGRAVQSIFQAMRGDVKRTVEAEEDEKNGAATQARPEALRGCTTTGPRPD